MERKKILLPYGGSCHRCCILKHRYNAQTKVTQLSMSHMDTGGFLTQTAGWGERVGVSMYQHACVKLRSWQAVAPCCCLQWPPERLDLLVVKG